MCSLGTRGFADGIRRYRPADGESVPELGPLEVRGAEGGVAAGGRAREKAAARPTRAGREDGGKGRGPRNAGGLWKPEKAWKPQESPE